LLVSVLVSKISDRSGIPALLLFLSIGMLAGSDGPGGIYFDDPNLTQFIGIVALNLILFAGGLDTQWKDVRPF
jgi:potassium/hydrogen antiporter